MIRRPTQKIQNTTTTPTTPTLFLSGAISGLLTSSLLHPLDTISGRLKVFSSTSSLLGRGEGLRRALYGGLSATLISSIPTDAVYFCTYEICKRELVSSSSLPLPLVHFVSGTIAEISCSSIYHPFEVVKTRMQLGVHIPRRWVRTSVPEGNYKHVPHALYTILRSEGLHGLYSGYCANLITGCMLSSIQFMLYEEFVGENRHSTKDTMLAGCLAGACAGFLTNPLDVIGTRIMVQGQGECLSSSGKDVLGYRACFQELYKAEGMRGLFRGAMPRVMWCAPFSGLSFALYEYSKRVLEGLGWFN